MADNQDSVSKSGINCIICCCEFQKVSCEKVENLLANVTHLVYVMFKKRAGMFYRVCRVVLDPITRAASFLNGFKNIHKKRVSWESEQRFRFGRERY